MPLREIDGPVGRLEALLDEPAADRSVGADGLLDNRKRYRACAQPSSSATR